MDEDTEVIYELRPARYDKWSIIGLGFNFASDFFDGVSGALGTASIMVLQHKMQMDVDKRFKEITSGK
jgi:hypothetical protein